MFGSHPPAAMVTQETVCSCARPLDWLWDSWTLAVLTSVVDSSVMTVVTPTISKTFHSPLPVVEWTTTIYSLFFGATMLLWGKMGSIFGHRSLFIFGSIVFALGSALVGWAPNIGTMIAMRALQGTGAAMFNPAAIALIGLLFGPKDRPLAYGINGMAGSVGVALGYVLGGACAEFLDWRWAYYLNLPICAIAVAGALLFIPKASEPGHPYALDVLGSFESLLGLGLLITGLSEAQTLGWGRARIPFSIFGASGACLACAFGDGRRLAHPHCLRRAGAAPQAAGSRAGI